MSETTMDNSFSEAVVVVDIIKADGVDGEKLKVRSACLRTDKSCFSRVLAIWTGFKNLAKDG